MRGEVKETGAVAVHTGETTKGSADRPQRAVPCATAATSDRLSLCNTTMTRRGLNRKGMLLDERSPSGGGHIVKFGRDGEDGKFMPKCDPGHSRDYREDICCWRNPHRGGMGKNQ